MPTLLGVVGLSQALRSEAALLRVKVSVVCPGMVKTGIFQEVAAPNFEREALPARIEQQRGLTPGEAADQILERDARNQGIIPLTRLVLLM